MEQDSLASIDSPGLPFWISLIAKFVGIKGNDEADPIALQDWDGSRIAAIIVGDIVGWRWRSVCVICTPDGIQLDRVIHTITSSSISSIEHIVVIVPILNVPSCEVHI